MPPLVGAAVKRVDRYFDRFARFEPFDVTMFGMYLGLGVWGVWAQIEPPLSLIGAAGFGLTRLITLLILFFAVASLVGIVIDSKACDGKDAALDVEFPAVIGLIGSWLTYVIIVWLLITGHGDPNQPPVLGVFGVMASVFALPFIVRFVTLLRDALGTFKKARLATEMGLVGGES